MTAKTNDKAVLIPRYVSAFFKVSANSMFGLSLPGNSQIGHGELLHAANLMGFSEYVKRKAINLSSSFGEAASLGSECLTRWRTHSWRT